MTEAKRIRKNYFFSFLSISSRLIANVIVFWIIARYYGPDIFGQFSLAHTIATISILLGDFGLDLLLTTEISRDRKNAGTLFQKFYSLKFLFSFTALFVMWGLSLFGNFSTATKLLILIFSFYMFFTTLTNFLYAFYKGFEKLEYETKVSLIINGGLLFVTIIFLIFKANIYIISIGFVLSRFVGFLSGLYYSFKILPEIEYKFNFKDINKVRNKILIFGFHLFFSNLYFQLDTILLGLWKGDREVGIYQSVFKLILLPLVIPDIFNNTLIPVLSRLNIDNKILWKNIGFLMNKILTVIIFPIALILFIYANQIINLIYGPKLYSNAIPILRIFAIILVVRFLQETYALMLTTSNRQHIKMFVVIFATLFNFLLNYFLIPKYGVTGAAMVSLITNTCIGIIYIYFNASLFFKWMLNLKMFILFSFTAIIFYFYWNFMKTNFIVGIVSILIIYLIIALMFFTKEERKAILGRDFLTIGLK